MTEENDLGWRATWKDVEKGEGKLGQKKKAFKRGEKGVTELFKHSTISRVSTDSKPASFS